MIDILSILIITHLTVFAAGVMLHASAKAIEAKAVAIAEAKALHAYQVSAFRADLARASHIVTSAKAIEAKAAAEAEALKSSAKAAIDKIL